MLWSTAECNLKSLLYFGVDFPRFCVTATKRSWVYAVTVGDLSKSQLEYLEVHSISLELLRC